VASPLSPTADLVASWTFQRDARTLSLGCLALSNPIVQSKSKSVKRTKGRVRNLWRGSKGSPGEKSPEDLETTIQRKQRDDTLAKNHRPARERNSRAKKLHSIPTIEALEIRHIYRTGDYKRLTAVSAELQSAS
jgi:hypothetical protein